MKAAAATTARRHRGTLFVEDGELLRSTAWPDRQFVQRIRAPRCARHAVAGSFVHLQCNPHIPMRRPLSIMRVDRTEGTIDVLFKVVGDGLAALADARAGDTLSLIGPIGNGFHADPSRPYALLIGGGVGIPPMIFLAEQLLAERTSWQPLVLMGSEIPFPFDLRNSSIATPWLDEDIACTLSELEDIGVCARLASLAGFQGCHAGYVTDLARRYLGSLPASSLEKTALYACGPTPMLRAVATLAAEFAVPCQVSLEEFMACAVGGCAGCAVAVHTADGIAMKRVCVDGPVFDAATVFPEPP